MDTRFTHTDYPFDNPDSGTYLSRDKVCDVADCLEIEDLGRATQVCHAWQTFFDHDDTWKHRVTSDFGITPAMIREHAANHALSSMSYKQIYKKLSELKTCPYRMPAYAKQLVRHHLHGNILLALAADNSDLLLSSIAPEAQPQWYDVSLYTGCKNIPFRLFIEQQYGVIKADYFAKAILAGHEDMYDHIINLAEQYRLLPTTMHCGPAIRSGSQKILKDIKEKCEREFRTIFNRFYLAVESGNLAQVQLVTDTVFGAVLDTSDSDLLNLACQVGATDIIDWLLEQGFKPNRDTINHIGSGGFHVLKYWLKINPDAAKNFQANMSAFAGHHNAVNFLLNPDNGFNQVADCQLLSSAALSGNHRLVLNLLKRGIKPNKGVLADSVNSGCIKSFTYIMQHNPALRINHSLIDLAANSGNLNMLQHLLALTNNKFRPDVQTLTMAIDSKCLEITSFLLNPFHRFFDVMSAEVMDLVNKEEINLTDSNSSLTCLLNCHALTSQGLSALRVNQAQEVSNKLDVANIIAPAHFATLMHHVMQFPHEYDLTDEQCALLKSIPVVEKVLKETDNNHQSDFGLNV